MKKGKRVVSGKKDTERGEWTDLKGKRARSGGFNWKGGREKGVWRIRWKGVEGDYRGKLTGGSKLRREKKGGGEGARREK